MAKQFGDLMQALEELYIEPHDYRTVVVDPLDAVERLIQEEVSRHHGAKPLNEIPQADDCVVAHWRRLLRRLDLLRDDIPLHVVLVARARTRCAAANLESEHLLARPQYRPILCHRAEALLLIWSDDILFATHTHAAPAAIVSPVAPNEPPTNDGCAIYTASSPSYAAKNHLHLPQQLPFDPAALLPYLQPVQAPATSLN